MKSPFPTLLVLITIVLSSCRKDVVTPYSLTDYSELLNSKEIYFSGAFDNNYMTLKNDPPNNVGYSSGGSSYMLTFSLVDMNNGNYFSIIVPSYSDTATLFSSIFALGRNDVGATVNNRFCVKMKIGDVVYTSEDFPTSGGLQILKIEKDVNANNPTFYAYIVLNCKLYKEGSTVPYQLANATVRAVFMHYR